MPINLNDIAWDDEEEPPEPQQLSPEPVEWDKPDIEWDKPELSLGRIGGALVEGAKDVSRSTLTGMGALLKHGLPESYRAGLETVIPALKATRFIGPLPTEKIGEPIIEAAKEIKPDLEYATSSGWLEDLARSAPQMAGQIGTSVAAGPFAGMGLMGLQIMGGTYDEAVKAGKDPKNALNWGIANAIMQAPMEQIGVSKITKLWKPQKDIIRKLKDIGEAMGVEWLTEFLQGIPEAISNVFSMNPDKKALDNVWQVVKDLPERLKESAYEGTLTAPWALLGIAGGVQKPHYIPGAELPGPNHPLIQAIRSDLDAGKITPEQTESLKEDPIITQLGLEDQIDRILQDYEVGRRRTISKTLTEAIQAQPGEERGKIITEKLIPFISRSGGEVEEVSGPTREGAQVAPSVTVEAQPTPYMGPKPEDVIWEEPAVQTERPPTKGEREAVRIWEEEEGLRQKTEKGLLPEEKGEAKEEEPAKREWVERKGPDKKAYQTELFEGKKSLGLIIHSPGHYQQPDTYSVQISKGFDKKTLKYLGSIAVDGPREDGRFDSIEEAKQALEDYLAGKRPAERKYEPKKLVDATFTKAQIGNTLIDLNKMLKRQPSGKYKGSQAAITTAYERLAYRIDQLRKQGDLDQDTIDKIAKSGVYDEKYLAAILPEAKPPAKAEEGKLPIGAEIVEVIGGRKKGVIDSDKGNSNDSAKSLLEAGIDEITIRSTKGTLAQQEQAREVLRNAGWTQWEKDKAIWRKPHAEAVPEAKLGEKIPPKSTATFAEKKPTEDELSDILIANKLMPEGHRGKKQYAYSLRKGMPHGQWLSAVEMRGKMYRATQEASGWIASEVTKGWVDAGIFDRRYRKDGTPVYAWKGTAPAEDTYTEAELERIHGEQKEGQPTQLDLETVTPGRSPISRLEDEAIKQLGLKDWARWSNFKKADDQKIKAKMIEIAKTHPKFNELFYEKNGEFYHKKTRLKIIGPREAGAIGHPVLDMSDRQALLDIGYHESQLDSWTKTPEEIKEGKEVVPSGEEGKEGRQEGQGEALLEKAPAGVTPGTAWIKDQWRPFTEYREITKGRNKGKVQVTSRSKKYIIEKSQVKKWPDKGPEEGVKTKRIGRKRTPNDAHSFIDWNQLTGGVNPNDPGWKGEIRDIRFSMNSQGRLIPAKGFPQGFWRNSAPYMDEKTAMAIEAGWLPPGSTPDDFYKALQSNPKEKWAEAGSGKWVDQEVAKEAERWKQEEIDSELEDRHGTSNIEELEQQGISAKEDEDRVKREAAEEVAEEENATEAERETLLKDTDNFDWATGKFKDEEFQLEPSESTPQEQAALRGEKKAELPKGEKIRAKIPEEKIQPATTGKQASLLGQQVGETGDLFTPKPEAEVRAPEAEEKPTRVPDGYLDKASGKMVRVAPGPFENWTFYKVTKLDDRGSRVKQVGKEDFYPTKEEAQKALADYAEKNGYEAISNADFQALKKGQEKGAPGFGPLFKATTAEGKKLADITVMVSGIREATGEKIRVEQNAQEALDEIASKTKSYEAMLECLTS